MPPSTKRWQDGQLRQVPGLLQRRVVGAQLADDAVVPPMARLGVRAKTHADDAAADERDASDEVQTVSLVSHESQARLDVVVEHGCVDASGVLKVRGAERERNEL
jgi:hypothetical protein